MNERQIIEALRARDPRGIAEVYRSYADGLYDYSWWLLRDHGTAREALHDALLAAGVHAGALRSPERLRAWLYALVRAECLRRSPATPRMTDENVVVDAAELRSLAWKATEAVPASESDALELRVRHRIEPVDVASICGMSVQEAHELLERAETHVGQALRVEMLVRTGKADCPELAQLLRERDEHAGAASGVANEAIDRHARGCSSCSGRIPRRVSIERLMGLMPVVSPPADLQRHVLDAYAEPRLLEYRLLAARRLQPLDRDGFPRPLRDRTRTSAGTAAMAAVGGLVVAGMCAGVGVAMVTFTPFGGAGRTAVEGNAALGYTDAGAQSPSTTTTLTRPGEPVTTVESLRRGGNPRGPVVSVGPDHGPPWITDTRPRRDGDPRARREVPDTFPSIRTRTRSETITPTETESDSQSPTPGEVHVSRTSLDLGMGSEGTVTLLAEGGPVHWSAEPSVSCLAVTPAAGGMDEGESVIVTFQIDRDHPDCSGSGSAVVMFTSDGPAVQVTWSAPTDSPDPSSTPPEPSHSESSPEASRS